MEEMIRLVGPERAVELFGVRLVGLNAENGKKLLFTLVFIAFDRSCWDICLRAPGDAGRCGPELTSGASSGRARRSSCARRCS